VSRCNSCGSAIDDCNESQLPNGVRPNLSICPIPDQSRSIALAAHCKSEPKAFCSSVKSAANRLPS
jgi:hypothetical protein